LKQEFSSHHILLQGYSQLVFYSSCVKLAFGKHNFTQLYLAVGFDDIERQRQYSSQLNIEKQFTVRPITAMNLCKHFFLPKH